MALRPWAERCAESSHGPVPLNTAGPDCTIGGNSPTVVYGVIEDSPGNTPLNRAKGAVRSLPGRASRTGDLENPYSWINSSSLYPMEPTNG